MKYIVIPKEVYNSIPVEVREQIGIDSPRFNTNETEVIMHIEHYDTLFPPVATLDEEEVIEPVYPYSVYTDPSVEFSNLLASEDWSSNEEEYDI